MANGTSAENGKTGRKLWAWSSAATLTPAGFVRSGARVSMPGMMDTVLNLGINDEAVEGLAKKTNNPRFAWDAYRSFCQMFGDVSVGREHSKFEEILQEVKDKRGVKLTTSSKWSDQRAWAEIQSNG